MKAIKRTGLALGLAGLALCSGAWADPAARHGSVHGGWHRGHGGWYGGWHGSVIIGGPLFWSYYWPAYPAYPYVPVPASAGPPPQYIERGQDLPGPVWFFCKDPKGYHPYVRHCPPGWITVTPPPAPDQPEPRSYHEH